MVFGDGLERWWHHGGDTWIGGQHDETSAWLDKTCKFFDDRWIEVMGDLFVNAPWRIRNDGGEGVRLECVGEKILLADKEGTLHFAVVDFLRFLLDGFHKFCVDFGSEDTVEGFLQAAARKRDGTRSGKWVEHDVVVLWITAFTEQRGEFRPEFATCAMLFDGGQTIEAVGDAFTACEKPEFRFGLPRGEWRTGEPCEGIDQIMHEIARQGDEFVLLRDEYAEVLRPERDGIWLFRDDILRESGEIRVIQTAEDDEYIIKVWDVCWNRFGFEFHGTVHHANDVHSVTMHQFCNQWIEAGDERRVEKHDVRVK